METGSGKPDTGNLGTLPNIGYSVYLLTREKIRRLTQICTQNASDGHPSNLPSTAFLVRDGQ